MPHLREESAGESDAKRFAEYGVLAEPAIDGGGPGKKQGIGSAKVFAEIYFPREQFMTDEAGEVLTLGQGERKVEFQIIQLSHDTVSESGHGKLGGSETL